MASTSAVAERQEVRTLVDRAAALAATRGRLNGAVVAYYPLVWRSVRRLGATETDADDIAQEVFLVLARRIDDVAQESEKHFLLRTAFRLLAHARRTFSRRREDIDEEIHRLRDAAPSPEEQADERKRRALLDRLLQQLPFELRAVLTLCAVEQVKIRDAAEILELPLGTVASRLVRARERIDELLRRERARGER